MANPAAYDIDLAYIHDTGYGQFARASAPGLLELISDCPVSSRLVIDLGCGSGIWAEALTASGYQVQGADISSAMIDLARARVPQAQFEVASFVDFPIPECRAVTALGEVWSYLFDPQNSFNTLRKMCEKIFTALQPGGLLVFDLAEPGRFQGVGQAFREGPDWTCLVEYQYDEPQQLLTRRIITFRRIEDVYRRREETHRQQLFERTAVAAMLADIGFSVAILSGYGTHTFPTGVVGFVARKPALRESTTSN